jgi:hypothetical protein
VSDVRRLVREELIREAIGGPSPETREYQSWCKKKGHITPYAGSVLADYALDNPHVDPGKIGRELGIFKSPNSEDAFHTLKGQMAKEREWQ